MPVNFKIQYETIPFGKGNSIDVRHLTLPDISALVDAHAKMATELFDKVTGRDPDSFTTDDTATMANEVLVRFPGVATHIIALAADAVDQFDNIKMLPIDVQVTALEKIASLTFQMQGGLGNFIETVLRIAEGANGLKAKVSSPQASQNGSTGSIGK